MTDTKLAEYLRENGSEHIRAPAAPGQAKWAAFVDEVERGYNLGLEDYRNDLTCGRSSRWRGWMPRADDERLRRMLTATDKRVWESSPGDPFWDFGYPKNASGELLEDLKAEALTD